MQSRVHQLDLHLAVHEHERQQIADIQQCVQQQFVTGVLDSLEKAMHQRYGQEAILHVRQLDVRWALDKKRLLDPQYLHVLGNELADEFQQILQQRSAAEKLLPRRDYAVFLYENAAHRWAVKLGHALDKSQSETVQIISDSWSSILASDSTSVPAIIDYLSRMALLKQIVRQLDIGLLQQILATVPLNQWPADVMPTLNKRLAVRADNRSDADARQSSRPIAEHQSSTQSETSGAATGSSSEQPQQAGRHSVAFNQGDSADNRGDNPSRRQRRADNQAESESAVANRANKQAADHASTSGIALHADSHHQQTTQQQALTSTQIHNHERHADEHLAQNPDHSLTHANTEAEPALLHTDYAGAFYVLNIIMELDLAERLWCVGIHEGDFFCVLFRTLLGKAACDDPMPMILSSRAQSENLSLPAVADWAAEEVQQKSLHSLQAMCRRRAIAVDHYLHSTLQQHASHYTPANAADCANATAIKLVAFCTALLVHAFGLRLGRSLAIDELRHMLQIPGRIEITEEAIVIVMPMESIDIDMRSAALDVNPGYLPWLKRNMVFEYEESD